MKKRRIHNLSELKESRKQLRNNTTSAEAVLWRALKQSQLKGRKFRRQHSIGNYVVDFYCPSEKLAIELDGVYHYTDEGTKRDQKKAAFLDSLGIRVIRIENVEVFDNIEFVLETIRQCFDRNE